VLAYFASLACSRLGAIAVPSGKLVFAGSIPQAMEFFASAGFQCPTHVNPGDFFLDLISVDSRTPQAARESLDRISLLVELFARSNASEEMDSSLDRAATQAEDALEDRHGVCEPSSSPLSVVGSACIAPPSSAVFRVDDSTARSRINYFSQTLVLLQRSLINMARDRMVILSRVLEALLLGFLVGMIFFQLEDTPSGIKSRIAALYSASSLQPFLIMLSIIIQCTNSILILSRSNSFLLTTTTMSLSLGVGISLSRATRVRSRVPRRHAGLGAVLLLDADCVVSIRRHSANHLFECLLLYGTESRESRTVMDLTDSLT